MNQLQKQHLQLMQQIGLRREKTRSELLSKILGAETVAVSISTPLILAGHLPFLPRMWTVASAICALLSVLFGAIHMYQPIAEDTSLLRKLKAIAEAGKTFDAKHGFFEPIFAERPKVFRVTRIASFVLAFLSVIFLIVAVCFMP